MISEHVYLGTKRCFRAMFNETTKCLSVASIIVAPYFDLNSFDFISMYSLYIQKHLLVNKAIMVQMDERPLNAAATICVRLLANILGRWRWSVNR